MNLLSLLLPAVLILTGSCKQNLAEKKVTLVFDSAEIRSSKLSEKTGPLDTPGNTVETRQSLPPPDFRRDQVPKNSFANYLRELPLKPHGTAVKLYNGAVKPNYNIYDAVVDLKIGKKDLHQCADAVMRLRAEYLWSSKSNTISISISPMDSGSITPSGWPDEDAD